MSRLARKISKNGMYNVVFRGINKQSVLVADSDYKKLLDIVSGVKQEMGFELLAYCLLSDSVQLFIKEQERGDLSIIMTKILSNYAGWFNRKYNREGALFYDRYKSEPIEDERYYFALVRYIHQAPVRVSVASRPESYAYSSYGEYVKASGELCDIDFILDGIDDNRQTAVSEFVRLHKVAEKNEFNLNDSRRNEESVKRAIMSAAGIDDISEIDGLGAEEKEALIRMLVTDLGISKSAVERIMGVSRYRITGICEGRKQVVRKSPARKKEPEAETPARRNEMPMYLM